MMTFGEPIREQGHTTKKGKSLERTWRQRQLSNYEANEEEELLQGVKSLHSGRSYVPFRRRV
jgi:hypothetical protein